MVHSVTKMIEHTSLFIFDLAIRHTLFVSVYKMFIMVHI